MKAIHKHTLWLILADNVLNWFLGIVLTFYPQAFEAWLAPAALFPQSLYIFNGLCFMVFAGWQVTVFLRSWKLDAKNLKIAAWLAWGPVVGLTIGLLLPFEIYQLPRILLWIGNLYMLWLGWWYWRVAKKLK